MFLKSFAILLCFYLIFIIFSVVSFANDLVYASHNGFRIKSDIKLSEYNCNQDLVSSKTENQIGFSISEAEAIPSEFQAEQRSDKKLTGEDLFELEKGMRLNVDNDVFPKLFSKYIKACELHKEEQRAMDYFHTLAGETNRLSPRVLTAKAVITNGWRAEKNLREGLKEIDKAIMLDPKAFFPRLCRATYLAYLPEGFPIATDELYNLLGKEDHNRSHVDDIYNNLSRIYREHGHYAMAESE